MIIIKYESHESKEYKRMRNLFFQIGKNKGECNGLKLKTFYIIISSMCHLLNIL
jgi:hypothetical protein